MSQLADAAVDIENVEAVVRLGPGRSLPEHEITGAPTLLRSVDLRGKVVVGDAMHTQRALSTQIGAAGGDYLWIVKDNQPTLRADIEAVFTSDHRTVLGGQVAPAIQTARQVNKGHGRQESRVLKASDALNTYLDWPGVAQVFQLERQRLQTATGKKTREIVYGITSLSKAQAPPARLLALTRQYWGIENGLHYCRDVTFHEDRTRLTQGTAGRVMAGLNNLILGLLRRAGVTNIAAERRRCDAILTQELALQGARLLL